MAAALVKAFANVGADIVNSIVSGIKAATSGRICKGGRQGVP